nr:MAG TPA: hypothetical protein [Crassvirales sp.]
MYSTNIHIIILLIPPHLLLEKIVCYLPVLVYMNLPQLL